MQKGILQFCISILLQFYLFDLIRMQSCFHGKMYNMLKCPKSIQSVLFIIDKISVNQNCLNIFLFWYFWNFNLWTILWAHFFIFGQNYTLEIIQIQVRKGLFRFGSLYLEHVYGIHLGILKSKASFWPYFLLSSYLSGQGQKGPLAFEIVQY